MKTALYFDEQDAQLVLTAESAWEKTMLKMLKARIPDITFEGGFYECQGGWIKQNYYSGSGSFYNTERDYNGESLMIRMPKNPPKESA